jgi:hypothetical protein
VIEIMDKADELAALICAEEMHGLVRIVQPLPQHVGRIVRLRRFIEPQIAVPERLPGGAFRGANGFDGDCAHGSMLMSCKHLS